jgi:GT2 family glycosyltransferase
MRVSFLIPAYNEAATIPEVLDRVDALGLDRQVIVVDDGSTDGGLSHRPERSRLRIAQESRTPISRSADASPRALASAPRSEVTIPASFCSVTPWSGM